MGLQSISSRWKFTLFIGLASVIAIGAIAAVIGYRYYDDGTHDPYSELPPASEEFAAIWHERMDFASECGDLVIDDEPYYEDGKLYFKWSGTSNQYQDCMRSYDYFYGIETDSFLVKGEHTGIGSWSDICLPHVVGDGPIDQDDQYSLYRWDGSARNLFDCETVLRAAGVPSGASVDGKLPRPAEFRFIVEILHPNGI